MSRPKVGDIFAFFNEDVGEMRDVEVMRIVGESGPAWLELEIKDVGWNRKMIVTIHKDTIMVIGNKND